MTESDLFDVIAYGDAAAAGMPAALGYGPVERACCYCGREIPHGRHRFCSDQCSKTTRQARWRARRGSSNP